MGKNLCYLVLIFLLGACAGTKPPLPPAPAAEILFQRLIDEGGRWRQLDAQAKVGFTRNGRFLSTQQFMLLEKPDRLRIDVLSLFGQLAMQLTVADGRLQVFLNTSVPGKYYSGPADDEVLARFTRLPLRASELVRLLLYDPPHSAYQTLRVETTAERYLLYLDGVNWHQQFFFDDQLRLRRCVYRQGEDTLLTVDYGLFDEKDDFPRRVQVEMPLQQTRVLVTFSDVRLNQSTKTGRFELTPPENAVPLRLPGLDAAKERS